MRAYKFRPYGFSGLLVDLSPAELRSELQAQKERTRREDEQGETRKGRRRATKKKISGDWTEQKYATTLTSPLGGTLIAEFLRMKIQNREDRLEKGEG